MHGWNRVFSRAKACLRAFRGLHAPAAIRASILAACNGAQEIGDRRTAIETAMNALGAGDVLVVAGKGHEQGQIVGKTVLPFDDASVIRRLAGCAEPNG